MYNVILITMDEIWIKGKNQGTFIRLLISNIQNKIKEIHRSNFSVSREFFRLVLESESFFDDKVIDILKKIPGVHSIYLSKRLPIEIKALEKAVIDEIKSYSKIPETFKIDAQRANKLFPIGSIDLQKKLGALALEVFDNLKDDLHNPELTITVKIQDKGIYLSSKKISCIGGLPISMNGKMLTLISGGLDSPVASYLMSRRGVEQDYIFFYAYPFVGEEVKEKIIKIFRELSYYQRKPTLYIVPFGEVQKKIADNCKLSFRTILIRKAMLKTAELLAKKLKVNALITGDALGQVSSQTLESMICLDRSVGISIIRPLVSFMKDEIIKLSKKIGLYETSSIPHDDACALFSPKHPVTRPTLDDLVSYDETLNLTDELARAILNAEIIK